MSTSSSRFSSPVDIHFPLVEYSLSPGIVTAPILILSLFILYVIKLIVEECLNSSVGEQRNDDENNRQTGNENDSRKSSTNKRSNSAVRASSASTVVTEVFNEHNNESAETTKNVDNKNSHNTIIVLYFPHRLRSFFNWCRRIAIVTTANATLGVVLLAVVTTSPSRYLLQSCFEFDNPVIQNSTGLSVSPMDSITHYPFYYFCYGYPDYERSSSKLPENFTRDSKLLYFTGEWGKNEGNNNYNNTDEPIQPEQQEQSIISAKPNCPFIVQNVSDRNSLINSNDPSEKYYSNRDNVRSLYTDCYNSPRDELISAGIIIDKDTSYNVEGMIILTRFGNVKATWYYLIFGSDMEKNDEYYRSAIEPHHSSFYSYQLNLAALQLTAISAFGVWGCELVLILYRFFVVLLYIDKEKRSSMDWALIFPGFSLFLLLIRPVKGALYFSSSSNNKKKNIINKDHQDASPLLSTTGNSNNNQNNYSSTTAPEKEGKNNNNTNDNNKNDVEGVLETEVNTNNYNDNINTEIVKGALSYEMLDLKLSNFIQSIYSAFFVMFCISYLVAGAAYGWFLTPSASGGVAVSTAIGLILVTIHFSLIMIPFTVDFLDFIFHRGPILAKQKFVKEYLPSVKELPFDGCFEKVKKISAITAIPRRGISLATTCVRIVYATLLLISYLHLWWLERTDMIWATAAKYISYIVIAGELFRQVIGISMAFSSRIDSFLGTKELLGFLRDTTLGIFIRFLRDPETEMIDYFFRRCDYEDEFANSSNYYTRLFITIFIEVGHAYDALCLNFLQQKYETDDENNKNDDDSKLLPQPSTEVPSSSSNNNSIIPEFFRFELNKDVTRVLVAFSLIKVSGSFFYLIYRQAELDWKKRKQEEEEEAGGV